MRHAPVLLWGSLLALAAAGCSGGSQAPLTPAGPDLQSGSLTTDLTHNPIMAPGALIQTAVGRYTIDVDLAAMSAETTFHEARVAQQSEIYSLSIANFLRPDSFTVDSVSRDVDSFDITYTASHPFPAASDLGGVASAANREDLAVTGRVLFLVDQPDADTYFAGDDAVSVNTTLLTNADGYLQPGGLITDPGLSSNTFPYKLLVDEAAGGTGNRVGVDNGGDVTGNYGTDGWDTTDFTNGISGYDIWAQGQSATNVIEIDRAAVEGGATFSLDAVIVVKYEDPRGGANSFEKRQNRLPGNGRDFVFRMPHGALDVAAITDLGEGGGLQDGVASTTDLNFRVRDWDARATESVSTNLAGESDPTLVSAGESGIPTVEVDIPGITGLTGTVLTATDDDSGFGGDPEADSGIAGDELFYTGTVMGTPPSSGVYTGLVRAIDVTDITPPADWALNRFNLQPDLIPLGTTLEGTTYQSFTVSAGSVGGGDVCPTLTPPYSGTDITAYFSGRTDTAWTTLGGSSRGFLDVAAFRDPAYNGWIFHQNSGDPLRRLDEAGGSVIAVTGGGISLTNRVGNIDVDSTNRVIYTQWTYTGTTGDGDPNEYYANAAPDFHWFDYSGSVVNALGGTVSTGADNVLSLSLDSADNVYVLTESHVLRKFDKAAGYTEDVTSPFPLNLAPIIGSKNGAGDDSDRAVSDFVINHRNGAFFILVHGDGGAAFDYLYRVECDGTFQATVNGNPNPYVCDISSSGHTIGTDIAIDQFDSSGNLLVNQGDAQIMITGMSALSTTPDGVDDVIILNSDLQETFALDTGNWTTSTQGKIAFSLGSVLFGKRGYFDSNSVTRWTTAPAGWQ